MTENSKTAEGAEASKSKVSQKTKDTLAKLNEERKQKRTETEKPGKTRLAPQHLNDTELRLRDASNRASGELPVIPSDLLETATLDDTLQNLAANSFPSWTQDDWAQGYRFMWHPAKEATHKRSETMAGGHQIWEIANTETLPNLRAADVQMVTGCVTREPFPGYLETLMFTRSEVYDHIYGTTMSRDEMHREGKRNKLGLSARKSADRIGATESALGDRQYRPSKEGVTGEARQQLAFDVYDMKSMDRPGSYEEFNDATGQFERTLDGRYGDVSENPEAIDQRI